MPKAQPKPKPDRRQQIIALGLVAALLVAAVAVMVIRSKAPSPVVPQVQGGMTFEPGIIANLTNFPNATPLSEADASEYLQLRQMVDECPEYTPERRSQMEQHITWLINPSDMPSAVILALGTNPTGKLIFGMAEYTSNQWRLLDRPSGSCLLPIGVRLNEMLAAHGEEPLPIFSATPEA
jgi:hypothetical protein